jgi:acyl transferase domain-containing protein/thioesterase domain-containing protein/2-polyprenyl-3-methyl-5-hydroxy-6-metoxy-1,4-benzoquinol methylase/acyl carrier protein
MMSELLEGDAPSLGIAVVGVAGRFPGAADIEAFWQNLAAGVESITTLTDADLLAAGVPAKHLSNPRYVRARARLDGVADFDAPFFGMSPREAATTDPQHRIFLECAWEALEHAGIDPARFPGSIGVYGGAGADGYLLHHLAPDRELMESLGALSPVIGNDKDHLTTRVAYKLDLRGPSITVQSACSTSLVAVQLACQALLGYQCDAALAGGVSVAFPQGTGHLHQPGNILSPDGHCRAFDASAQGTVPGDGVGIVVLRRLADALEDGDSILAVILGAAVNNDGSAKVGYTAPSVDGQAEVIAMAHAVAGVSAETISYVEAHGTGTALGDPIEIAALTQAFRAGTDARGTCGVGSLKTNIGHLNTAAGVASLIKVVLALHHEALPATLHFETPNPAIDFASSPFVVNATHKAWPRTLIPRRAGVSSFGFGGTNAHVVLEEAPAAPEPSPSRSHQLLVLSARSPAALATAAANLAAHLEQHRGESLADVAHTLSIGRRAFAHRRAVVAKDSITAASALRSPERGVTGEVLSSVEPKIAFLFPGQGAQHPGMGADLYRSEPVYRAVVDECAAILQPLLGRDIRPLLHDEAAAGSLAGTALAQPALFVVELALARLWMSFGILPDALLGHSLGELVAACLAGVFSLADALALVTARGRLMAGTAAGAMLSIDLAEQEIRPLLGASLSLAALNGPLATVVSGPEGAVARLEAHLAERHIGSRRLRTSHAFHSAAMDPILAVFTAEASKVRLSAPSIPCLSSVTGALLTAAEATSPAYWARQIRSTVRFSPGLLAAGERRILLEVGPGRALSALAQQHGLESIASLGPANSLASDVETLLGAVGRLWVSGARIDWSGVRAGEVRRRVHLPTYPFERRRHWVELPSLNSTALPGAFISTALPGAPTSTALPGASTSTALPGSLTPTPLPGGEGLGAAARILPLYPRERGTEGVRDRRSDLDLDLDLNLNLNLAEEAAWLSATETEITAALAIRPIESYPGLAPALDALSSRKVVDFLVNAGIPVEKGQALSRQALLDRTRIVPKLVRLFDAMLAMLAEDGILRLTGDEVRFLASADSLPSAAELRAKIDEHPGFQGLLDFLDHCSASYPDSLTGRIEAIGVLYPGGSTRLVEESQRTTLEYRNERIYITLLVKLVARIVAAAGGKRLRILEVGGGQGLLTWPLVESLAASGADVEVHFTDLGKAFVDDARRLAERKGLSDLLRFGTLDASRDPAAQGYDLQSFDLVVAYNVLHATRDVTATVEKLASLLVPGGTMAWVEVVKARRWDTLTWGLAEGWWYYDDAVRKESPLLALDQWVDLTRSRGFEDVGAYPRTQAGRAASDHGLIVARGRQVSSAPVPARAAPRPSQGYASSLQPRPALRTPHVAPRDETERRIAAICGELLGIEGIGVHDDFFELGADSLITLRITDRIRQELGREVPAHAAFRGSTVERMARALERRDDPSAASPLVAIQPHGSRPPLFFVHPAAGIVFPYFALARELGPDQPFYGLQALGLDGLAPPDRTIEEMARHYIEALRAVQPRGPYFIGGFSFGCLVAFEMAQQLNRAGQELGLVALVDEPAPVLGHRPSAALMARLFITGVGRTIWPHLHDYFYLIGSGPERAGKPGPSLPSLKELSRIRPDADLLQSLLARSTMANFVPPESRLLALRQPAMKPMFELFLLHVRQTLAYRPEAYPHGVTVFQATSLGHKYDADPSMGWRVLAAGGVESHKIPGEHLELLRPPNVQVLAAKLNESIDRGMRKRR